LRLKFPGASRRCCPSGFETKKEGIARGENKKEGVT